uniref:Cyclin N-terminal domain-containing protein n=1 Tax=Macrostomum lignano TaxID=282301 RepID=A0A1I8FPC9_9PLAT
MNDDQPMREPRSMLRVCLWEEELRELGVSEQCSKLLDFTCRSLVVTPFHFSESTRQQTPAALVLLMLALSVTFYRRFVGDPNVENDHPDGARKFLCCHKASRECLDKQAVETVCRTLEEMRLHEGLSSREIWAYEVVHLQKLRELGYKLLEFLDDLKRDTRDSHNLAPTQVLTDVAMTLVLEREVRCLTNRDKEVPVHAFSAFQPERRRPVSIGIQQSMAQVPTRLTDVGPAGHPERHGLNYAAANTQLLSWAGTFESISELFLASTSNRASHIHAGRLPCSKSWPDLSQRDVPDPGQPLPAGQSRSVQRAAVVSPQQVAAQQVRASSTALANIQNLLRPLPKRTGRCQGDSVADDVVATEQQHAAALSSGTKTISHGGRCMLSPCGEAMMGNTRFCRPLVLDHVISDAVRLILAPHVASVALGDNLLKFGSPPVGCREPSPPPASPPQLFPQHQHPIDDGPVVWRVLHPDRVQVANHLQPFNAGFDEELQVGAVEGVGELEWQQQGHEDGGEIRGLNAG